MSREQPYEHSVSYQNLQTILEFCETRTHSEARDISLNIEYCAEIERGVKGLGLSNDYHHDHGCTWNLVGCPDLL